jgi:TorA maturation chaperone TorD
MMWPNGGGEKPVEIDDSDVACAREYSLLALLLARAPDAATLNRIAKLRGDATPLDLAHVALAQAADNTNAEKIELEFFNLFIGIGRGELLPYGSYYLTGFLNERPLARLREDLSALGVERPEGLAEPEDHAAILCEIMAALADGQFAATAGEQQVFRKAPRLLDRPLLRRSRTGRGGRFLPSSGRDGPALPEVLTLRA